MAVVMAIAVALVGVVAYVLSRVAHEERVSDAWRNAHVRDRRDDA
jgi:hypothetical protein